MSHSPPNLQSLLHSNSIFTQFQPLVSLKRGKVFGFEGLSRAINDESGAIIPPNVLFSLPTTKEELLHLDRRCREKALETFAPIYHTHRDLMISINIDAAIIDSQTARSEHLIALAEKYDIAPSSIIIEIIESRSNHMDSLCEFIQFYKNHGFLVALDDFGAGHSNFDRISLLKPNIFKLDRSLVSNIDTQFHKREVAQSLANMANRIGAIVIGEGVEREEEVITLLELGVEFFQGFYFGRPSTTSEIPIETVAKIKETALHFKHHMTEMVSKKRTQSSKFLEIVSEITEALQLCDVQNYNSTLNKYLNIHPTIECNYLLDKNGIQISETVINAKIRRDSWAPIYEPELKGADHSLKDYFIPISAGLTNFTTEPYISLASGNRCATIAKLFSNKHGDEYILCTDITGNLPSGL